MQAKTSCPCTFSVHLERSGYDPQKHQYLIGINLWRGVMCTKRPQTHISIPNSSYRPQPASLKPALEMHFGLRFFFPPQWFWKEKHNCAHKTVYQTLCYSYRPHKISPCLDTIDGERELWETRILFPSEMLSQASHFKPPLSWRGRRALESCHGLPSKNPSTPDGTLRWALEWFSFILHCWRHVVGNIRLCFGISHWQAIIIRGGFQKHIIINIIILAHERWRGTKKQNGEWSSSSQTKSLKG